MLGVETVPDDNKYCRNNVGCLMKWNKFMRSEREGVSSLTSLGNLGGYVEDSPSLGNAFMNNNYGASFMTVHREPKYYTYTDNVTVRPPWLALQQDKRFMNYIEQINKGGFPQTYKDLKLSPIPFQTHETYKPSIYGQVPDSEAIPDYPLIQAMEPFSWDGPGYEYTGISRYIWKFFLIFIVILFLIWFMKKF
jgi:hypothetical protein